MRGSMAPAEAYRTVEFDARIAGSDGRGLVALCYEQFIGALGTAIHARQIGDAALHSRSISRCLSSIIALEMGLVGDEPVVDAMRDLYARARNALLGSVKSGDCEVLERIRNDFIEIDQALRTGR